VNFAKSNGLGKRKRVTGLLELGARRLQLVTDAGDRWTLDYEDVNPDLVGQLVTAEGVLVGMDRLKVDWIGDHQG
jgi:cytochrome c-type biogenesis protein CcmE